MYAHVNIGGGRDVDDAVRSLPPPILDAWNVGSLPPPPSASELASMGVASFS